jgi:hypothetical protein
MDMDIHRSKTPNRAKYLVILSETRVIDDVHLKLQLKLHSTYVLRAVTNYAALGIDGWMDML